MNISRLLLLAAFACCSCSQLPESITGKAAKRAAYDKLVALYYEADTVLYRPDSVIVVNTKLDTVAVETGIFAYLSCSYPLSTPAELVQLLKQAGQAEMTGDTSRARELYLAAVGFYQHDWLKRKSGFENGGFSCANDYYSANNHVAILVSAAFEKLGRRPEALKVLAPFLANSEAGATRIDQRFVELCIKHYGKARTRRALDSCGNTVHRHPQDSPVSDQWRVSVFGADLALADFNSDSLSPQQARDIIRNRPFYALLK